MYKKKNIMRYILSALCISLTIAALGVLIGVRLKSPTLVDVSASVESAVTTDDVDYEYIYGITNPDHDMGEIQYAAAAVSINSTEEFFNKITADPTGNYVIESDLDFTGYDITSAIDTFSGQLDGNKHTFTGLSFPLFKNVKNGTILNIHISNSTITEGYVFKWNNYTSATTKENSFASLLIGQMTGGRVSYIDIEDDCAIDADTDCVGGIIGLMQHGAVYGCTVSETTTMNASQIIGGVVAVCDITSSVSAIEYCTSNVIEESLTVGVDESAASVGGIVGYKQQYPQADRSAKVNLMINECESELTPLARISHASAYTTVEDVYDTRLEFDHYEEKVVGEVWKWEAVWESWVPFVGWVDKFHVSWGSFETKAAARKNFNTWVNGILFERGSVSYYTIQKTERVEVKELKRVRVGTKTVTHYVKNISITNSILKDGVEVIDSVNINESGTLHKSDLKFWTEYIENLDHTLQGEGTSSNPYRVSSVIDLCVMNRDLRRISAQDNNTALYYEIRNSIDLSTYTGVTVGGLSYNYMFWRPFSVPKNVVIRGYTNTTRITLDGDQTARKYGFVQDNYGTLSGFEIHATNENASEYIGAVVNRNYGTIERLQVEATVTHGAYSGGIAGYNGGIIKDCYMLGGSTVNADKNAGGVVGYNAEDGEILISRNNLYQDSSVITKSGTTNVSNTSDYKSAYIGGVAGLNEGHITVRVGDFEVTNKSASAYVGGIVGNNGGELNVYFNTTPKVINNASESYIGGIAGYNEGSITVNTVMSSDISNNGSNCHIGGVLPQNDGEIEYKAVNAVSEYRDRTTLTTKVVNSGLGCYIGGVYAEADEIDLGLEFYVSAEIINNTYGSDETYIGGVVGYCRGDINANRDYSSGRNQNVVTVSKFTFTQSNTYNNLYVGGYAGYCEGDIYYADIYGGDESDGVDIDARVSSSYIGGVVGLSNGDIYVRSIDATIKVSGNNNNIGTVAGYVSNSEGTSINFVTSLWTTVDVEISGSNNSYGAAAGNAYGDLLVTELYLNGNIINNSKNSYIFGISRADSLRFTGCRVEGLNIVNAAYATGTYIAPYAMNSYDQVAENRRLAYDSYLVTTNNTITNNATGCLIAGYTINNRGRLGYITDSTMNTVINSTPKNTIGGLVVYNYDTIIGYKTTNPGGIAAYNIGTIGDCQSTSYASYYSADGSLWLGGIAACSFGEDESTSIYRCTVDLDPGVDAIACNYLGGIVGETYGTYIRDCTTNGQMINGMSNYANVVYYPSRVGGIAGDSSNSTITNCTNYANILVRNATNNYAGGIVGYSSNDTISYCKNLCKDIDTASFIIGYSAGGIAGDVYGSSISYSVNEMNIGGRAIDTSSLATSTTAGGIVGTMEGGTISHCASSGNLYYDNVDIDNCKGQGKITAIRAGGVVGTAISNDNTRYVVEYSYCTGSVETASTAGVVGYAGGIVGFTNAYIDIYKSYYTGAVIGSGRRGLIIGGTTDKSSTISNSYAAVGINPIINLSLVASGTADIINSEQLALYDIAYKDWKRLFDNDAEWVYKDPNLTNEIYFAPELAFVSSLLGSERQDFAYTVIKPVKLELNIQAKTGITSIKEETMQVYFGEIINIDTSNLKLYASFDQDIDYDYFMLGYRYMDVQGTSFDKTYYSFPMQLDNTTTVTLKYYKLFTAGNGTVEDPFQIWDETEFNNMAEAIAEMPQVYAGLNYSLVRSLMISWYWIKDTNMQPVGAYREGLSTSTDVVHFTGTFKGNGHTIDNIYMRSNSEYTGLFAYNEGTITDLTVTGEVSGTNYVGTIAGYNEGTISGIINLMTVSGGNYVGGIAGYNEGTITESVNIGKVSGDRYVGGIAGYNDGTIDISFSMANISGSRDVGGIAGGNDENIVNVYNAGTISASNTVGGIVGTNAGSIDKVYNINPVQLKDANGVAGLVAGHNSGNINNSYALAQNNVGAVGSYTSRSVNNAEVKAEARELSYFNDFCLFGDVDTEGAWSYKPQDSKGYGFYPYLTALASVYDWYDDYMHLMVDTFDPIIFARGRGTQESPFVITNLEQLYNFKVFVDKGAGFALTYTRNNNFVEKYNDEESIAQIVKLKTSIDYGGILDESVRDSEYACYRLDADIEIDYNEWFEGFSYIRIHHFISSLFRGSFDGNGHTLTNCGTLFYEINGAKISNLTIKDTLGKGASQSKSGYSFLTRTATGSTITNCHVSADISSLEGVGNGDGEGGSYLSLMIGKAYKTNIVDCSADGEINYPHLAYQIGLGGTVDMVGGLVGYIDKDSVIRNSTFSGSIDGGASKIGGIAGVSDGSVVGCTFTGSIRILPIGALDWQELISHHASIGGIVGVGNANTCYNKGTINVYNCETVGGIIGEGSATGCTNMGNVTIHGDGFAVGGIVGSGSATTSANYGKVSGYVRTLEVFNNSLGGIVGTGSVTDSHNYGTVIGENNNVGGLVGCADNTDITGCHNEGQVTGNNVVGGIVGGYRVTVTDVIGSSGDIGGIIPEKVTSQYTLKVSGSYNLGKVTGKYHVGGIAGIVTDITSSFNRGAVSGYEFVGGIAGSSTSTIKNTYNTGSIVAEYSKAGGIVGQGIEVSTSYNAARVTSPVYVGGIMGDVYSSDDEDRSEYIKIYDSYFATDLMDEHVRNIYGGNKTITITDAEGMKLSNMTYKADHELFVAEDSAFLYTENEDNIYYLPYLDIAADQTELYVTLSNVEVSIYNELGVLQGVYLIYESKALSDEDVYPMLVQEKLGRKFTGFTLDDEDYDIDAPLEADISLVAHYEDYFTNVDDYASQGYFIISSSDELVNLSRLMSEEAYRSLNYVLYSDIDMAGVDFEPIGNSGAPFAGTFDGNGYFIYNLTVSTDSEYAGLFGYLTRQAVVSNIGLIDAKISTSADNGLVGGIAGFMIGATVDSCLVVGEITASGTASTAGGIVGAADNFTSENRSIIDKCVVLLSSISAGGNVGGIVGIGHEDMDLTNCYVVAELRRLIPLEDGEDYADNAICGDGSIIDTSTNESFVVMYYDDEVYICGSYEDILIYNVQDICERLDVSTRAAIDNVYRYPLPYLFSQTHDDADLEMFGQEIYRVDFEGEEVDTSDPEYATRYLYAKEAIIEPVSPSPNGYLFEGWFNGSNKWDFDNIVDRDITLTARWNIATLTSDPPISERTQVEIEALNGVTTIVYGAGSITLSVGKCVNELATSMGIYPTILWYKDGELLYINEDTITITDISQAGNYYAIAIVEDGYAYQEDRSNTISAVVRQTPYTGELVAPSVEVEYADSITLNDIELPEGWSWKAPDTHIYPSREIQKYQVVYTPEDKNYAPVESMYASVKVNKHDVVIEVSRVETEFTYNGLDIVIDSGATVDAELLIWYKDNVLRDPGTYIVTVYTLETDNYNASSAEVTIHIAKADSSIDATQTQYVGYTGEVIRPSVNVSNSEQELEYSTSDTVNVGTYTVRVKAKESKRYNESNEITVTLVILKSELVSNAQVGARPLVLITSAEGFNDEASVQAAELTDKDSLERANMIAARDCGETARVARLVDINVSNATRFNNAYVGIFAPKSITSRNNVRVLHIKDSGESEEVEVTVKDSYVYFAADSFSQYAIIYDESGSENMYKWLVPVVLAGAGLIALSVTLVITLIQKKRNSKAV